MEKDVVVRVVNIKGRKSRAIGNSEVYIGRLVSMGGWNLNKSKWNNPFDAKECGIEQSLELYKNYIKNNAKLMNSLSELKNKTLACWCHPNRCHGDILIELLNENKINDMMNFAKVFGAHNAINERTRKYIEDMNQLRLEFEKDIIVLESQIRKIGGNDEKSYEKILDEYLKI